LRLLLDEMYDRAIAERLRDRGHDVVAVTERDDLRGVSDAELLTRMAGEERVIVTENAPHFVPAFRAMIEQRQTCFGVLGTSPKTMPRGSDTVGIFVRALERELRARPARDALLNQMAFLKP
jgi:NAD(P)-dependent dehydrogenase (short-subunit alcohol dehydrogenase family)